MNKSKSTIDSNDFILARTDINYLNKVYNHYAWLVPHIIGKYDIPEHVDRAEIEELLEDSLIASIKRFNGKAKRFYIFASKDMFYRGLDHLRKLRSPNPHTNDVLRRNLADSWYSVVTDSKKNTYTLLKDTISDKSFENYKLAHLSNRPIASKLFDFYLTDREKSIITMMQEGKNYAEIAKQLNVSLSSVGHWVVNMRNRIRIQLSYCTKVAELRMSGLKIFEIAKKLGISDKKVSYYIRMYSCVFLGVEPTSKVDIPSLSVEKQV